MSRTKQVFLAVILSLVFILAASSHAWAAMGDKKLLDCNTPGGPDQQITVIQRGSSMILRELSAGGRTFERDLSQDEWDSQKFTLISDDFGTESTLSMTAEDGWVVQSKGFAYSYYGFASCQ